MNVPKRRKLFTALGVAVGLAGCAAFGGTESAEDGGDSRSPAPHGGRDSQTETSVPTGEPTGTRTTRPTVTPTPKTTGTPTATTATTTRSTPTPTNETTTPADSLDGGGSVVSGSSGGAGGSVGGHVPVSGGPSDGGDRTTSTPTSTPTSPRTPTDEDAGGLDPAEVNVVAVEATRLYDGRYMFEVTLSQDASEGGFADWWQVETRDGERLGRRAFFHDHAGQASFSSLHRIAVPDDEPCVVVRGHDSTNGYGGQAMVLSLASGETSAVRQGSSRDSLAAVACPGRG